MSQTLKKELIENFDSLPFALQQQVLYFVRALKLTSKVGNPGKDLLDLAGAIDTEDLQEIEDAIEDGCERIDKDAW